MLQISELSCGYAKANNNVINHFSLNVSSGTFVCVIGRNGAGKSTLLRTISGLQEAMSGYVSVNGEMVHDMAPRTRAQVVSVVTTERVSAPGLTVRDVIDLGRQPYTDWHGQLTPADHQIIQESMELMNTAQFIGKPFDGLSDGERQRVMISRSLVQSSLLMVMDEITAFLDLPGRVEVMALLREHARKSGKLVLLSSHDLELSLELADQLWIVDEGKVVTGTAQSKSVQGSLSTAFNSKDVRFDSGQRQFKLQANLQEP